MSAFYSDLIITPGLAVAAFLLLRFGNRLLGLVGPSPEFDAKWPPINEEEFIRRCRSGVDREKALRVRRIISAQLGIPYDQVYPEQNFVNDLGC